MENTSDVREFGSTPDLAALFTAEGIYFASLLGLEAGDWNTTYLQTLWPEWEQQGDGGNQAQEKSSSGAREKVFKKVQAPETKPLFVLHSKEQFGIPE